MANPQFSSILDQKADDIERPKPLPPGDYVCVVKGKPIMDKSSQKQTPYVQFTLVPLEAMETVDEDLLADALTRANGEKKKLADSTIRATYYDTPDAGWRLKKFLITDCQIDNSENKSIGQLVEEAEGCQVIARLRHRSSDDGESVFAELRSTAPLKEEKPAARSAARR